MLYKSDDLQSALNEFNMNEVELKELAVNQEFDNVAELVKSLDEHAKREYIDIVIDKSVKVDAYNRNLTNKLPKHFYWSSVVFICKFSKKYVSNSHGIRNVTSSYKSECEFKIDVRIDARRRKLVVKQFINEHKNHERTKELYANLPGQRAFHNLTEKEKVVIDAISEVKTCRAEFNHILMKRTGRNENPKAVSNHKQKMKKAKNKENLTSAQILLKMLEEDKVTKGTYYHCKTSKNQIYIFKTMFIHQLVCKIHPHLPVVHAG